MSEIKPALTAEEWAGASGKIGVSTQLATIMFASGRNHALAAACLHEQPFGFTREDVIVLRAAQDRINFEAIDRGIPSVKDLADRIEALLPPLQKQCQWVTANVEPPGNRCGLTEGHDGECEYPALPPPEGHLEPT